MTSNTEALDILAMVAEEFRISEMLNLTINVPPPRLQKIRTSAVSQHGSAWTYQDNVLLWKAYEEWENDSKNDEIRKWKRNPNISDRSFPFYAFKKHFFKRRTLISVKKHFFKLKQSQFGRTVNAEKTNTVKITIPKQMWDQHLAEDDEEEEEDGEEEEVAEFFSDAIGTNKEERAFLRISNNALHRRKKQCLSQKQCSQEVEFRNIVRTAQASAKTAVFE